MKQEDTIGAQIPYTTWRNPGILDARATDSVLADRLKFVFAIGYPLYNVAEIAVLPRMQKAV